MNFSGTQIDNYIYLTFTLEAGITCNGLVIERSTSTNGFAEVGNIPGVCGSASSSETYTFSDSLPLINGINYYRLNLGNLGYSNAIGVSFYKFDAAGVSVFPQPVIDQGTIYFSNSKVEKHQLFIYNHQGLVFQEAGNTGNTFVLKRRKFASGIYFFKLVNEKSREVRGIGKILFL